jgi:hypothetical protein
MKLLWVIVGALVAICFQSLRSLVVTKVKDTL